MKKITSLLMMLVAFFCTGVMNAAETQPEMILGRYKVSNSQNKYYYVIKSARYLNEFVKYDESIKEGCNIIMPALGAEESFTTIKAKNEYLWYFEKGTNGGYLIKNKACGDVNVSYKDGANAKLDANVQGSDWYIQVSPFASGSVTIGLNDTHAGENFWNARNGTNPHHLGFYTYDDAPGGCAWYITSVDDYDEYFKISTETEKHYYYIRSGRFSDRFVTNDNSTLVCGQFTGEISELPTNLDDNSLWYFVEGKTPGTLNVKCKADDTKAAQKVENDTKLVGQESATDLYILHSKKGLVQYVYFASHSDFKEVGGTNWYWNFQDNAVKYYNQHDDGSNWILYSYEDIVAQNAENNAQYANHVKELTDLSNEGVYTLKNPRGDWAYQPTYVSNTIYTGTDMLICANMKNAGTVSDENKQFAVLKSANNKYYLYNIASKKFVSAVEKGVEAHGATYLSEKPISAITLSKGTQKGANFTWVIKIDGKAKDCTFGISTYYVDCGGLIFDYDDDADEGNNTQLVRVENATFSGIDKQNAEAAIAEFETSNSTLTFAPVQGNKFVGRPEGYNFTSTFVSSEAKTLPEGVKAYYVASSDLNNASLTEISTTIPANIPVVLLSKTATAELTAAEGGESVTTNLLKGTVKLPKRMSENDYVLATSEDGTQFYKASKASVLLPNKAYLPLTASAGAAIKMNFGGEATGIEAVETENADAPIYDLSGRRVNNTVKGGIYIQNGKKFIVK